MMKMVLLVVIAVASTLLMSTDAATYTVGESTGWTIPSSTSFYSDWASGKTFNVGDVLEFTFTAQHDLFTVDESSYTGCTSTSPIATTSTSPASITLNATGMHYYICTIGSHCTSGQKLAINVTSGGNNGTTTSSPPPPTTVTTSPPPPPGGNNGTTASSPPPPTTNTTSPPPPPGSGATAIAASFFIVCLSVVISLVML